MIEAKIDASDIDRLVEKISKSPDILKEAKRQAFEAAAPKLKQALDSRIGGSGKVRSWQEAYTGSKGGYAAVRPKAETYIETKGIWSAPNRYAVGYVTNAINSGHRFPGHGVSGQRYRSKKERAFYSGKVPGKQFYEQTEAQVQTVAEQAANEVLDALAAHLEG